MDFLIFDMDGVLLRPHGYHRALQETVKLAGQAAGFGDVWLEDDQIATFEALGISSEWHSSALCLAVMKMQKQIGIGENGSSSIDLDALFEKIAEQPIGMAAVDRGSAALLQLAEVYGVSDGAAVSLFVESESIDHSPTMNWFQELILGSQGFAEIYQKPAQFNQESYLLQHDSRMLSPGWSEKLLAWSTAPEHGAAVMTNRPSSGPPGFTGLPDADLGLELVGLNGIPVIGYGEIIWLSEQTDRDSGSLNKPFWAHALAAVLVASGWDLEKSLSQIIWLLNKPLDGALSFLSGSTFTVFEDTPAGLTAVQNAADFLGEAGINIKVKKIGIATETVKKQALSAQGAEVFPDVNTALESLDLKLPESF